LVWDYPQKEAVLMPANKDKKLADLQAELDALKKEHQSLLQECRQKELFAKDVMETERLAKAIISQSPAVLFRRLSNQEASLVYVSDNVSQWGYDPRDLLAGRVLFRDVVHPDDKDRISQEIEKYKQQDLDEYEQEYRIIAGDGKVHWVHDRTSVVRGDTGEILYNQGLLLDVTLRKQAEQELEASERKHRRILETAGEGFVLMDLDLKFVEVNQAYLDMLGYTRQELEGKSPMDLSTPEFREYMLANKEEFLSQEYRLIEGELVAKDGRVVPVLIHANTLTCEDGTDVGNVAFVADMTMHKQALALAGEVQKSLLPQEPPSIKGFDIAGKSVSCEDVGGDYFDFLQGVCEHEDNLCVAVGDISGHGVDAALLMTSARAFLRARAQEPGGLSFIMDDLNRHLAQDLYGSGRFMTMFALAIEMDRGRISWVRAGHDPALLYSPNTGDFSKLGGEGLPIAVVPDTIYQEQHLKKLTPGQIVAIGTDGIWEACSQDGEMFGKQRFMDIIRDNSHKSALHILDEVYDAVERFTYGMKPADDITLVIVKAVE
jgi:sigma-B regulation protein RsbU (phosphoserine phosphatase)